MPFCERIVRKDNLTAAKMVADQGICMPPVVEKLVRVDNLIAAKVCGKQTLYA